MLYFSIVQMHECEDITLLIKLQIRNPHNYNKNCMRKYIMLLRVFLDTFKH